ncbi:glycoside hydrolase family 27 protein [Konateibacter massiliensis]|uniref:glycoside hydrolase family 27 protein n=1 Tax=Konateibacter massiliensis TaxID=2002841 RepID=UPI000C152E45|nr:glycoside hydrolase family 27 protein [Konateibacter massiliensis]
MNKNNFAKTPPMGWNSYDYYDTTVTEADIKKNADYMAANLLQYGYEYVVADIEWYAYDAGTKRDKHQYIPFSQFEMDEFSRLFPCLDRFPSTADGNGFKPLADYIHGLGLKFGIHIMRGIPRMAAHMHSAVKGSTQTANEIANPYNICPWNPDMYGLLPNEEGSQKYYDSLLELYAEWGVDLIKCDDICRMDMPSAKEEIKMLHKAIEKCGRPIVLSLSPGPALPTEAWTYEKHANMWRITDDLWDNWESLLHMFERCEIWQNHVSEGNWPDCDMLPVGYLGKGFGKERKSNLTLAEQQTMLTLWCIFRSPIMLGCELTKLDDETLAILTNQDVLRLLSHSQGARQIVRDKKHAVWCTKSTEDNTVYVALFNLSEEAANVSLSFEELSASGYEITGRHAVELWSKKTLAPADNELSCEIEAHGTRLFRFM